MSESQLLLFVFGAGMAVGAILTFVVLVASGSIEKDDDDDCHP